MKNKGIRQRLVTNVLSIIPLWIVCWLIACDYGQNQAAFENFYSEAAAIKTAVNEFYYTNGYLPDLEHDREFKQQTGYWEQFTIVDKGIFRFELDLGKDKKFPIFLIASIKDPNSMSKLNFRCSFGDVELQPIKRQAPYCDYTPDFQPNKPDIVKNNIEDNVYSIPSSLDKYKKELYINEVEKITECFKKWDIAWKFPYVPTLRGKCRSKVTSSSNKSLFFTGKPRQTIIKLDATANPLIPSVSRKTEKKLFQAALNAHFDALFLNQGFIRTKLNNSSSAVYERNISGKLLRVSYREGGFFSELLLEELPSLKPEVKLPNPEIQYASSEKIFNLFNNGLYGIWFSLPHASLIKEEVNRGRPVSLPLPTFEQSPFLTPYWNKVLYKKYTNMPFVKKFIYEYPIETSILELNAVYQMALENAGWKINKQTSQSLSASINVQQRLLTVDLNFRNEVSNNKVDIELNEPEFNVLTEVIYYSLDRFKDYIFMPTFTALNEMTESTKFQVMALDSYIKFKFDSPQQGIVLSPTVGAQYKNDSEVLAQAIKDTELLVNIFKKLGWQYYRIYSLTQPVIRKRISSEFVHGVQVSGFYCRTKQKTNSPDKSEICECRNHFKILEEKPGACQ